jgi:hypothetical protein
MSANEKYRVHFNVIWLVWRVLRAGRGLAGGGHMSISDPPGAPPLKLWLYTAGLLALIGVVVAGLVLSGADVTALLL